jgi:hypothetical protein
LELSCLLASPNLTVVASLDCATWLESQQNFESTRGEERLDLCSLSL